MYTSFNYKNPARVFTFPSRHKDLLRKTLQG